jgi:pyruvate/2-oxoglutarate dehydrogenase complex dihydrolipoamide acyltransferase (E2) component
MHVHYTEPSAEVVPRSDLPEDAVFLSHKDLRVSQTMRVSVTYDVAKVDEIEAAEFIAKMKWYLNDPELLLL